MKLILKDKTTVMKKTKRILIAAVLLVMCFLIQPVIAAPTPGPVEQAPEASTNGGIRIYIVNVGGLLFAFSMPD